VILVLESPDLNMLMSLEVPNPLELADRILPSSARRGVERAR